MVSMVACHARDRGSNPGGPQSFFSLTALFAITRLRRVIPDSDPGDISLYPSLKPMFVSFSWILNGASAQVDSLLS